MNNRPLLEVKQLTCIRQQRLLFQDLNFDVSEGQIWQVAGPNGAGKTSLLRILAGLTMPYEGHVLFDGEPIDRDTLNYNKQLLYIGHQTGVKAELTATENLQFALALNSNNSSNIEQLLEQVDLYGYEDEFAALLSAGQQRRIALARLWQSQSKLWILDEPFTAIDKVGVRVLEQKILNHANNGGAVILTTHQDLSFSKNQFNVLDLGQYASEFEGDL